jgi:hypothetical protein
MGMLKTRGGSGGFCEISLKKNKDNDFIWFGL